MFNSSQSRARYSEIMNWKTDEDYQEESDASDPPQFIIMWESRVQHLYLAERLFFLSVFCIIVIFAITGNVLTLVVIAMRKQQLLFKVCLLSLSMSDLLFTTASGLNYISKLSNTNTMLWFLGSFECATIPFAQVSSVLIGSISLVAIALDRYLAVLNKSRANFLQSKLTCFSGLFLVWSLSFAISSPSLFTYELCEIYVVPDNDPEGFYKAYGCMTEMDESANFYIVVFTFIFLPIFVAFVWLNTIIAKEIWKRRHAPGSQSQSKSKRGDDSSSTLEMKATDETNTSSNGRNNSRKISPRESKNSAISTKQPVFTTQPLASSQPNIEIRRNEQRRCRQMRMFKVILVLMTVFIVCRLPNWIFLLYKLTHKIPGRLNWLLLYSFAVMGLLNCMLNPLLYTFLGETIRITSYIGSACYKLGKICRRSKKATSHYANNQTMFTSIAVPPKCDGGIYLGS